MLKVWKYEIMLQDEYIISVPRDSRPLRVGLDGKGDPCVWLLANVNFENITEPLVLRIAGTGHEIKPVDTWEGKGGDSCLGFGYIGSIEIGRGVGWEIYHVFARLG